MPNVKAGVKKQEQSRIIESLKQAGIPVAPGSNRPTTNEQYFTRVGPSTK